MADASPRGASSGQSHVSGDTSSLELHHMYVYYICILYICLAAILGV
jgi:hypothetical protein